MKSRGIHPAIGKPTAGCASPKPEELLAHGYVRQVELQGYLSISNRKARCSHETAWNISWKEFTVSRAFIRAYITASGAR